MRKLLLPAILAAGAWAQPVVSNISTVETTHSTVTLKFQADSVGAHVRVRYGRTTNYESEGGCAFPDCGIQDFDGYDTNPARFLQIRVGGLPPAATLQFCPQVSANGTTWSTCVNHQAATTALPAIHPEPPAAPVAVDTTPPDTSGYTVRPVESDCSDLQAEIHAAAAAIHSAGSLITIPAGTVCDKIDLTSPPNKTWNAGNVVTSTSTINLSSHGFSEGDLVAVAGETPGSAGPDACTQYRGLVAGSRFYIKYIDGSNFQLSLTNGGAAVSFTTSTITVDTADNWIYVTSQRVTPATGRTVQFVGSDLPAPLAQDTTYYVVQAFTAPGCGEPAGGNHDLMRFKVSTTPGGSEVDITDEGTGTNYLASQGGETRIAKIPTNWIVIRTSTPDAELIPTGVRITPEFASKLATIRTTSTAGNGHAIYYQALASHFWFTGIEITHSDVATSYLSTTINPPYIYGLIYTDQTTSRIMFDRCYIHSFPWPNRIWAPIELNGRENGIVNSYMEHFQYWTPFSDITPTWISSTQFTLGAGSTRAAPEGSGSPLICTLPSTTTVTMAGLSGNTTVRVYCDMEGNLIVHSPTGSSASCSPTSCTSTTSATPSWPTTGSSPTRATVLPIAHWNLSSGALVNSHGRVDSYGEPWTERQGDTSSFHGIVQGQVFRNNFISGTGILWHISDNDAGLAAPNIDVDITRSTFHTPPEYSWYQPGSLKLRWFQRQQVEFKSCTRCRVKGNRFLYTFLDNSPNAAGWLASGTPGPNTHMRDIEVSYNLIGPGSGTLAFGGGRPLANNHWLRPPTSTARRIWIHDNVAYSTNALAMDGGWKSGLPPGFGFAHQGINLDIRGTFEDVGVDHNTFYDTRGTAPAAMFVGGTKGELFVRSNIWWVNHGIFLVKDECADHTPPCGAGDGKSVFDNMYSTYDFAANSAIAGYTDATGMFARTSKTYLSVAWPSMIDAYLQSELPGEIAWRSPSTGNFRLQPGVSHLSSGAKRGMDGRDRGADVERLDRELGTIRLAEVLVGASTATIRFLAPDHGSACYVLFGEEDNPAAWTGRSSANTADSYSRSISISVTAGVDYRYRVGCAGTALSETGRFRL